MFSSPTRTRSFGQGMNWLFVNQPWKSVPGKLFLCISCFLCSVQWTPSCPWKTSFCFYLFHLSFLLLPAGSSCGNPLSNLLRKWHAVDKNNFSVIPECDSLISIKLPQTALHWVGCTYEPTDEQATQYKYLEKKQVSESLSGLNSATIFKKLCWLWKEDKTMFFPMF